jgi:hypothetical protein
LPGTSICWFPETREIRHLFLMTGASPNTGWLWGCLARDNKRFIKTGADLPAALALLVMQPPD